MKPSILPPARILATLLALTILLLPALQTAAAQTVSDPFTDFSATDDAFEDRVELAWEVSSVDNSIHFEIARDGTQIGIAAHDQTSFIDATATNGTTHSYTITAVDAAGATLGTATDTGGRSLFDPSGIAASDETREDDIFIQWTDNSGIEDRYELVRSVGGTADATFDLGANVTSYLDVNVVVGTQYQYCVTGYAGTDATATICDSGTRALVRPPAAVEATDGLYTDRARVRWTDQSNTESGFVVYRDGTQLATLAADLTTYDDQTAASGTDYTYCVTALSSDGTSESSLTADGACDTGRAGSLDAPTGVTASAGTFDDQLQVSWSYDVDPGGSIDRFEIFRSDAPTAVYGETGGSARAFSDLAATPGTSYGYCVQAVSDKADDTTGPSVSAQGCTTTNGQRAFVLAPSAISATDDLEDSVELAWTNTSSSVMLYNVYRAADTDDQAPTSTSGLSLIATKAFDQQSYADEFIESDVAYDYCVTAVTFTTGSTAHGRLLADGREAVATFLSEQQAQGAARTTEAQNTLAQSAKAGAYQVLSSMGISSTAALEESDASCAVGLRSLTPPTDVAASFNDEESHVEVSWTDASSAETGYRVYRARPLLTFDGVDDVVAVPNSPLINTADVSARTIELWFRADDVTSRQVLYEEGGQTHGLNIWFENGQIFANAWSDAHGWASSTQSSAFAVPPIQSGVWHHVALIFRVSGTSNILSLNLDGTTVNVQVGSLTDPSVAAHTGLIGIGGVRNNTRFIINGIDNNFSGAGHYFTGEIRDVRIWNRNRLGPEINADRDVVLSGNERDLVAYYPLYEGAGSTASDLTANQLNAPIEGNAAWTLDDEELVAEVSGTITSRQDYEGVPGQPYTYIVRAIDEYASGSVTESQDGSYAVSAETQGRRFLEAPTDLVASDAEFEGQVVLTWTDNSRSETGYEVRRDGQFIATLGENVQTYTDRNPHAAQTDIYTVRAIDDVGVSGQTADAGSDVLLPAVSVNASDTYDAETGIVLTWVDVSETATTYWIWRDEIVNGSIDAATTLATTPANVTTYTDATAVAGITYEYCVQTYDSITIVGGRPISEPVCDTGSVLSETTTALSDVDVTASDGAYADRIQLRWTNNNAGAFGGYVVKRRDAEGTLQEVETLDENTTAYNDFSALPGNAYEYCIVALDTSQNETSVGGCAPGWRPANGAITGRVATFEGGGTKDVEILLSPNPNNALLLDGAGGYVQIPNADAGAVNFAAADDFTVEVWLNYTGTAGTGTSAAHIIEFWGGSGPYPFVLRLDRTTFELIFARYDGSNNPGVRSTRTDLNDGTWHHIALVHDGAAKSMTIFVDGVQDATTTYTTLNSTVGSSDLFFGRRGNRDQTWFGGQMDEVRIWNMARMADDIQATMTTTLTGDEDGLVGYWPLDQGARLVAPDLTGGGANGTFNGGVYWSDDTPFPASATTDENGNYAFSGIRYGGSGTTFTVSPSHPRRTFDRLRAEYALSEESPIQNEVDFVDKSAFTVSGTVTYEQAPLCPVPDVQLFVQEQNEDVLLAGTSESDGTYALAVDPSDPDAAPEDTRTITLALGTSSDASDFSPTSFSLLAEADSAGVDFLYKPTRFLSGFSGGGGPSCLQDIGDLVLTITTENGCFNKTVTLEIGSFELELPPQEYLIDLTVTNVPSGLADLESDIVSFFEGLGTQAVDLTSDNVTLDFVYHAPLSITVTGLPTPACSASGIDVVDSDGTTVLRTLADAPIVEENEVLNLTIEVAEDYGSRTCAVEEGTITIFDAIADVEDPITLELKNGLASYTTFGRSPDVFSGRIVDGEDRSFQKPFSVTAEVEGLDTVNMTEWVLVEGFRERTGSFVSATTSEIPLLVLHDPPGSQSYAYLEEGTTHCSSLTHMEVVGGGAGAFADLKIGFKASAGLGFSVESGAGLLIEGRTVGGRETSRLVHQQCTQGSLESPGGCLASENLEICVTTTEEFATSDNPSAVQDDIFVGLALNLIFAKADVIQEKNCEVMRSETLAAALNPDDAFSTTYVYSKSFIERSMLPDLENLIDLSSEDQALNGTLDEQDGPVSITLGDAVDNWQGHLDMNADNIERGLENAENRSFSGGLVYEHSYTREVTAFLQHDVDIDWGRAEGDIGAVITGAGYDQKFGLTFEIYGEFITEEDSSRTESKTVGWVFDDGDGADFFTVDVGSDPVYGTPVFEVLSGRTSNPCEAGTQCRDNPVIMASPPEQFGIDPDSAAVFTLTIGNDSESGERREYVLAVPGEHNLGGAVIKANGNILGGTNLQRYLIDGGEAVSVELSVERGAANSSVFSYEDLAVMVYPEDEYEIWRADMRADFTRSDTAFVSVNFASSCASLRLAELPPSWTFAAGDPALRMLITDYSLDGEHVDGDLSQLFVGAEYRRAGSEEWVDIVRRNGHDLQAEGAASFFASWMPADDGQYEVRGFTQCGAPANRVATVATVGTVDTHAPAVFAPEPRDGSLGIGDEARVIFDEELACSSVTSAEIHRLANDGSVLETLPEAQVGCDGRTVTVAPEGGWSQAQDGERYRVRLLADGEHGPADALGNTLASDVTWQFIVQRADFSFNPVRLDAVTARGSERTLEVNLANGKDEEIDFTLGGMLTLEQVDEAGQPTGASVELAPSVQSGTIAAQSNYPVQFALPPTLAVGTWRGQLTASGAHAGASLGTVPFFTEVQVECAALAWHIGPAAFAYQMAVIAELMIDGAVSTDALDQLAAFVGGELRGLASPTPDGKLYLTVFGDLPQGETVTFKAWHAASCTLSDITQSTPFVADAFVDLGGLTPGALEAQSVALAEGWTWFSLNRNGASVALKQALSGLSFQAGDQIKGLSDGQSSYDDAEGWTGTLSELQLGQSYQIELARGGVLRVPGAAADATTPISLEAGVNWIGYLPETTLDVNTALSGLRPTAGDQVKSQRAFAHYVAGTGWVGSLVEMAPGQGYVLNVAEATTLSYPKASGAAQQALATRMLTANVEVLQQADKDVAWRVDEEAYRYSMTLTGIVAHDYLDPEALRVGAFIDGEARGSAKLQYVKALDAYRFFLLVHSDEPEGQQVTFQLFDETTEETLDAEQILSFEADAAHGTPEEPMMIAAKSETSTEVPEAFALGQNYPNPFNPATTIAYALPQAAQVELVVYDLLGRAVLTLVQGEQEAGRYEVIFDASRLASGMYLYRITAGDFKAVKKMILVK